MRRKPVAYSLVIRFPAAMFRPLIFPLFSFVSSSVAKIFTSMILCAFCVLPTHVCDEETKVRNFDSHMQVEYGRASLKVAYRAENFLFCKRCIFKRQVSVTISQAQHFIQIMIALKCVHLMSPPTC